MIPEGLLMKAAKPVIDTLIKDVIAPKITKFAEKCKLKYDELLIPKGEHFEEYLYRTYKKYSIMNTLVFKNEQKLINDLYIPLTLVKEDHQRGSVKQVKITEYPSDLVKEYNKILITDTAGMGKSTLTKRLFLDVIEKGCGIPVYIEMRRLVKDRPILFEIQEQINSLTKEFDKELLLEFIRTGGFVFFLDGYDEISIENRNVVTTNVQDFISKAGNNVFIMTSRPEQALASFGDFQVFSINPLAKKEAYELLRKYDNQGATSKHLIDELKSGRYEMINDFLKNPLLVSLLFAAFDYKQTIPLKKHIFYRQVYDAYFDSHDLSKGDSYIHDKCSKLDIDDFERVLRYVGFKCLKFQKIEFEKDALLQIIEEAKDYCSDLNFSNSDFFNDVLTAVPLFCKDGQYYRWVHKSLQEYFAAQFIYKDSKTSQDDILTALYNSPNLDKYLNLLDLYFDIDNWGFKKNIVLPLCESYIKFYEDNIFTSNIVCAEEIENRIGHMFMCETFIQNDEKQSFKKVEECASKFIKQGITSIIRFNDDELFVSNFFDPKRKLFSILINRQNYLFRQYTNVNYHFQLPPNTKIYIDTHSGEENDELYKYYNSLLGLFSSEYRYFYYLNYSACVDEVKKIKIVLAHKEKTSSLTEGL